MEASPSPSSRPGEVGYAFLRLGLISFGGPIAHLSYFHEEFVLQRRWLSEEEFADLLSLCQFLPGPASSQMVYAIGMRRAGFAGAMLGSLAFTLPSAVLMILGGYGVAAMGDLHHSGWLHGLKLAAVGVVAQAVWGMGRSLCPDWQRRGLALGGAAILLAAPGAAMQLIVLCLGGVSGWAIYRHRMPSSGSRVPFSLHAHSLAACALVLYGTLLLLLPLVVGGSVGGRPIAMLDSFYRAGALVFGGGHVVLPLLQAEVVPNGWVSPDAFLAGYGMAQALPGPLFTFAAYLGTVAGGWLSGLLCLGAIFFPAWLLIGGALPLWEALRGRGGMQAALRGTNAAVVGLLLAALYSPVITQGVHSPRDAALALVAFGLLQIGRAPAWAVVLLAAAVGALFY